jgi:hypothetical protein
MPGRLVPVAFRAPVVTDARDALRLDGRHATLYQVPGIYPLTSQPNAKDRRPALAPLRKRPAFRSLVEGARAAAVPPDWPRRSAASGGRAEALPAGQVALPGFRPIRDLGRGAFGRVYLARRPIWRAGRGRSMLAPDLGG